MEPIRHPEAKESATAVKAMNTLFPETELDQKVDALKCDPAKRTFFLRQSAHGRTGDQLQLQSPRLR